LSSELVQLLRRPCRLGGVDGGWFGAQRLYLGRQWDDAANDGPNLAKLLPRAT
jgi:hypothetical protein